MKTALPINTAGDTESTPEPLLIEEDFESIKTSFEKNLLGKPRRLALSLLEMLKTAPDHTLSVEEVAETLKQGKSLLSVRDIITQMNGALVKKPGWYVVYDNHCLLSGGVVFHRKNLPQTFKLMWRNTKEAHTEQQRRLSLA